MEYDPDTSLADLVLRALTAHPLGISEYELIQWLKNAGHKSFKEVEFWNRFSLFQTHFILFHTLYKLKHQCWENNRGRLEINPLKIILLPIEDSAENKVAEHDPLMDYYLDIDNLKKTTDHDITDLLSNFWRTLSYHDMRAAALQELELDDPVDYVKIKHQHRRLVMQHHPDRGGNKEKLQAINAAMDVLEKIHKKQQ